MGLRYRKSIKIGPARINLSKSGLGWSIGAKGVRFTKKAGGGYRTTVGAPGTGVSYSKDYSAKTKGSSHFEQNKPQPAVCHVSPERRKKEQKIGAVIGICFAALVLGVIVWKLFGSLNIFAFDVVYTEVVPDEAVWDVGSTIEFVKYPGSCRSGDSVLVEIKAEPNGHYSIVVYGDSGRVQSSSLIGTSANATGKANWRWTVPENSAPGIYYIQVSDRSGNQNCIDYCILDEAGNVVGDPPSREKSIEESNQSFAIEIEDIEYASGQGQVVYITATGFKYHKSTCKHVSAGATAIDLNTALAQGYSACQACH